MKNGNRLGFIFLIAFNMIGMVSCSNIATDSLTSLGDTITTDVNSIIEDTDNEVIDLNLDELSDIERYNMLLNDEDWEITDIIVSDSPIATYVNENERLLSSGFEFITDKNGSSKMIYKGILQKKKDINQTSKTTTVNN